MDESHYNTPAQISQLVGATVNQSTENERESDQVRKFAKLSE